jgi:hypothetical protein
MSSAHKKSVQLQKKIYRSLQTEVKILLGETPESIRRYEKENRRDFQSGIKKTSRASFCVVSKQDLVQAVRQADVTFIADFHTFDQAQKTALRIMRESIDHQHTWMIGLELIPSQFQNELDQFQLGQINLEEFHQAISYYEQWGFPWKNYAPLFDWARENQIRLIALNRPVALLSELGDKDLELRDQWAAGMITDVLRNETELGSIKKRKMIVLYGDLHVGTQHLPKQLQLISKPFFKKPLTWISVHQNEDRLYWKLAEDRKEIDSEVIQLKKNVYCVLSSTPWAKLQSLVSWAEGDLKPSSKASQSSQTHLYSLRDELDYLSLLQTYGNMLAEFLGIQHPHLPSFEKLSVFSMSTAKSLEKLCQEDATLSRIENRIIRFHLNYNQRIYIPKIQAAYLGTASENGIAELSAIYLMYSKTGCNHLFHFSWGDFLRLILEAAFGFLGSLILNPRRKCELLDDHRRRLNAIQSGDKLLFPQEARAREMIMKIVQTDIQDVSNLKKELSILLPKKHCFPSFFFGAKKCGSIFGKKLHQILLKDSISLGVIHEIFFDSNVEKNYLKLLELISQVELTPDVL